MDVMCLDLPDNSFDVVICNHVLELVEYDKKAISEIRRVLKSNGVAILQVPICPENEKTIEEAKATDEERSRCYGQWDHLRRYGMDYKERLVQNGLEMTVVKPNLRYAKYCVNLYIATKHK